MEEVLGARMAAFEQVVEQIWKGEQHTKDEYLSHCKEVSNILSNEFKCNSTVASAGLFHNIYLVPELQREPIQAIIGDEAERLVWNFSKLQQPRVVNLRDEQLEDRIQLLLIEMANALEVERRRPTSPNIEMLNELDGMIRNELSKAS